ncbi:hypothetical protein SELMODRAFT_136371 [Selaginella moellendorffii]|uniref:Pentacotripeptide-repeat region of PRORP domain-containing protein n=1 Tax=Selaginella moellendorffii TaxID=88036 RepID=D8TBR8_SELML|nr:hypothetical protein SELMODRAFT_136371 [Selaginella moellendorffii]
MPDRTVTSWTALVAMYAQNGYFGMAKEVFYRMPERNTLAWNAMIQGLSLKGDVLGAKEVFDAMPERDLVAWTTIVTSYAQNGHFREAIHLFSHMPERDLVPWNALITALAQGGRPDDAITLFQLIPVKNITAWSAIVGAIAHSGDVEGAKLAFSAMPTRDLAAWNILVQGFIATSAIEAAMEVFSRMPQRDTGDANPDALTFNAILTACSHAGRAIDRGFHYFAMMIAEHGIAPLADHFQCLIDGLCRSTHLARAYELLTTMPHRADMVSWTIFLAACRVYGETDLAALAARCAVELSPEESSSYVLLFNTYIDSIDRVGDRFEPIDLLEELSQHN